MTAGTPEAVRRAHLCLEMAAGHLNAIAGTPAPQIDMAQWQRAIEDHDRARDAFRHQLQSATGLEASLIERALSL